MRRGRWGVNEACIGYIGAALRPFRVLHLKLNHQGLIDMQKRDDGSTAVRVTRASKFHMLCDANGTPLRFLLSGGQARHQLRPAAAGRSQHPVNPTWPPAQTL